MVVFDGLCWFLCSLVVISNPFFSSLLQRRKLGDDEIDGDQDAIEWKNDNTICNLTGNKIIKKRDPNDDHLVRETKEKKVVSREQTDERLETQDIQHFGDFSDEVGFKHFLIYLILKP